MSSKYKSHFVVADTQLKPGVAQGHLTWAGRAVADYQPDVIVVLGDWWDFPSLSSYSSTHSKLAEGYTLHSDFSAGYRGMAKFEAEFEGLTGYSPRKVFLMGNHENRLQRYKDDHPHIDTVPQVEAALQLRGWEVVPFLEPRAIHGIHYCHYFCLNAKGKVTQSKSGAPNAKAQLRRAMASTISGHAQGLDWAMHESVEGRKRGIIAGSFYQHKEKYLTKQGDNHWNGCLMLHDVHAGNFDLEELSLERLRRIYR